MRVQFRDLTSKECHVCQQLFDMSLSVERRLPLFVPSKHLCQHLSGRDPRDVSDHALQLDIGALQSFLQFVGRLAAFGRQAAAMGSELAQVTLLSPGNEAGTQRPWRSKSAIHSASWTSVFLPGTAFI